MSLTLNDMATEVAKIIGGTGTANIIELSKTAIKASIEDWNAAKWWNFLLKDTENGSSITVTVSDASASITAPSTGAFDGLNVGQSVTMTGGSTIPAGTTIATVTRNTTGSVASITLSNVVTTGGSNRVLTVSTGDIPIIVGTSDYAVPTDFNSPYSARLLTQKRLIQYIKFREWNKKVVDQSASRAVEAYTIYNSYSPLTQNYGTYRLRVFGVPASSDTIRLQYFRRMDPAATTVDIPNDYIYMFIDYAQWRLAKIKNTEDSRLPHLYEVAIGALNRAMQDDEENSEDEELRLISQMETFAGGQKAPWGNGEFYPTILDY